MGDQQVDAIARAAGLSPTVPAVRGMVDPAFAELVFGVKDPTTVAAWYTAVITALQTGRAAREPAAFETRCSGLQASCSRLWRGERKRRHREEMADLHKRPR